MAKTVWKYQLQIDNLPKLLTMPAGAKVTFARAVYDDLVQFWAWHDTTDEATPTPRIFQVTATAEQVLHPGCDYVMAIETKSGFVVHLWELTQIAPPQDMGDAEGFIGQPGAGPFSSGENDGGYSAD